MFPYHHRCKPPDIRQQRHILHPPRFFVRPCIYQIRQTHVTFTTTPYRIHRYATTRTHTTNRHTPTPTTAQHPNRGGFACQACQAGGHTTCTQNDNSHTLYPPVTSYRITRFWFGIHRQTTPTPVPAPTPPTPVQPRSLLSQTLRRGVPFPERDTGCTGSDTEDGEGRVASRIVGCHTRSTTHFAHVCRASGCCTRPPPDEIMWWP